VAFDCTVRIAIRRGKPGEQPFPLAPIRWRSLTPRPPVKPCTSVLEIDRHRDRRLDVGCFDRNSAFHPPPPPPPPPRAHTHARPEPTTSGRKCTRGDAARANRLDDSGARAALRPLYPPPLVLFPGRIWHSQHDGRQRDGGGTFPNPRNWCVSFPPDVY